VVEAEEDVRDDEAALRYVGPVLGKRDRALELRDVVVAEVADDRLPELLGLLERDDPLPAADERVAAEPSLVDRLEEKRRARGLAQPDVRRERSQEVGIECGDRHGFTDTKNDPRRVVRVERCGLFGA
jgi:hypothetical protein